MPPSNPQAEIELALKDSVSSALKTIGANLDAVRKKAQTFGEEGSKALLQNHKEIENAKKAAETTAGIFSRMHGTFTVITRSLAGPFGALAGFVAIGKALESFNTNALQLNKISIDTHVAVAAINKLSQAYELSGIGAKEAKELAADFATNVDNLRFRENSPFYRALVAVGKKTLADAMYAQVQAGDTLGAIRTFYEDAAKESEAGKIALKQASGQDKALLTETIGNINKAGGEYVANLQDAKEFQNRWVNATTELNNAVVQTSEAITQAFIAPGSNLEKLKQFIFTMQNSKPKSTTTTKHPEHALFSDKEIEGMKNAFGPVARPGYHPKFGRRTHARSSNIDSSHLSDFLTPHSLLGPGDLEIGGSSGEPEQLRGRHGDAGPTGPGSGPLGLAGIDFSKLGTMRLPPTGVEGIQGAYPPPGQGYGGGRTEEIYRPGFLDSLKHLFGFGVTGVSYTIDEQITTAEDNKNTLTEISEILRRMEESGQGPGGVGGDAGVGAGPGAGPGSENAPRMSGKAQMGPDLVGALSGVVHGREVSAYGPDWLAGKDIYEPMSVSSYGGGLGGYSHTFGAGQHEGLDMMGNVGTPTYAMMDGTVTHVGYDHWGQHTIRIDYGQGLYSVYLHQHSLNAKVGDTVKGGQQVGTSGFANAAHSHVELHWGNKLVNPKAVFGWNNKNLSVGGRKVKALGPNDKQPPPPAPASTAPVSVAPAPPPASPPPSFAPAPPFTLSAEHLDAGRKTAGFTRGSPTFPGIQSERIMQTETSAERNWQRLHDELVAHPYAHYAGSYGELERMPGGNIGGESKYLHLKYAQKEMEERLLSRSDPVLQPKSYAYPKDYKFDPKTGEPVGRPISDTRSMLDGQGSRAQRPRTRISIRYNLTPSGVETREKADGDIKEFKVGKSKAAPDRSPHVAEMPVPSGI